MRQSRCSTPRPAASSPSTTTAPTRTPPLAEGWIEGEEVECPLHSSSFSLRTGKVTCLPATVDARTHKVEVRDGQIVLFPGTDADPDACAQ